MKIPAQSFIVVGALALAGCDPAPPTIAKSPVSPESAVPLVKEKVDGDVEKRVRRIVVEQLGLAPEKVSLASKFVELGADSLDFVELVMAFEEEFSVSIPDERAENLKTVADVVVYLSKTAK